MGNYFRRLSSGFGGWWTRFWFTPSDAIVLSLVRVLTGLVALWWYLTLLPDLQNWFGPDGIFSLELARYSTEMHRNRISRFRCWIMLARRRKCGRFTGWELRRLH